MTIPKKVIPLLLHLLFLLSYTACKQSKSKTIPEKFAYEKFKAELPQEDNLTGADSSNIFDEADFIPGKDSLQPVLIEMDTLWHRDAAMIMMEKINAMLSAIKEDSLTIEAKEKLKENIRVLDSFLLRRKEIEPGKCKEKECMIYIAISKSKQKLYLYIDKELKDSFLVSTGTKYRKTPNLNTRPSGPIFTKYTSRKFPGGNYNGLGNMPYAVFVRGGYAIHGTTKGNFAKLGKVASHGCIRVHPDNAKIIYSLAKQFGLENMWVTIRDSL
jgi:hypothetical protein